MRRGRHHRFELAVALRHRAQSGRGRPSSRGRRGAPRVSRNSSATAARRADEAGIEHGPGRLPPSIGSADPELSSTQDFCIVHSHHIAVWSLLFRQHPLTSNTSSPTDVSPRTHGGSSMLVRHRTPSHRSTARFDRAFEQLTNSFFDPRRQRARRRRRLARRRVRPHRRPARRPGRRRVASRSPAPPSRSVPTPTRWSGSVRSASAADSTPTRSGARHVDGRLTVRIGTVDEPEARRIAIDTTPSSAGDRGVERATDDDSTPRRDQSTDTNDTE